MEQVALGSWDKLYSEQPESFRHYPNTELMSFLSRQHHNQRVLEIGCGNGSNLWAIAKEGFRTWGIDSSREAVRSCYETLERWGASAIVCHGDLMEMGAPWDSFDIVCDVLCLQHVEDLEAAYGHVASLLGLDGKFFSVHLSMTDQDDYEAVFPEAGFANILTDFHAFQQFFRLDSLRFTTRTYGPKSITHAVMEGTRI